MLFGRKTPPTATPKPAEVPVVAPAVVEAAPEVAPEFSPGAATPPVPGLAAPAPAPFATAPAMTPAAMPAPATPLRPTFSDKGPEMNTTPPKPPAGPFSAGPSSPASSFKPSDIPRRTVELPGAAARKPDGYAIPTPPAAAVPPPPPPPAPAVEQRRLIVGRDISLSGEIGSCDVLVVEGTVEAKLRDGRSIEITENGLFKGSVEIDEADIGGRFEGDIVVRGRLTVRSTGRISGTIKYGELMIEAGGQLIGDVQVVSTPAARPTVTPLAIQPVSSFGPIDGA